MVMQVSNSDLQKVLDDLDYLHRFGLNTPRHFLIHDEPSYHDFLNEWCPKYDVKRYMLRVWDRDEFIDHAVFGIHELITCHFELKRSQLFGLATPFLDEQCVFSGRVVCPFYHDDDIVFHFRHDHQIPFEHVESIRLAFEHDDPSIVEGEHNRFFDDVRKVAQRFPYKGAHLYWSAYKKPNGLMNDELTFMGFDVYEEPRT